MIRPFALAAGLTLLFSAGSAQGNPYPWRTVYFEANAVNVTANNTDMHTDFTSSCVITVTNPSSQNQNMQMAVTVTAAGTGAGTGSLCTTCGGESTASGSIFMASGQTRTFIFNFPAFPRVTLGTQTLACRGNIQVQDVANGSYAGQLVSGFIVASGTISSFTQSTRSFQLSGPRTQMGVITQSQVAIVINQGKPF